MDESLTFDEATLLKDLQNGSPIAFTRLYNQYSVQIYSNVLRMIKDEQVAEEIVQDIFTCIWQKRGEIRFEQSFAAYLYRMARNRVCDFYRKLRRDRALYEKFKAIATEHYSHIEETLHFRESEAILQQAIANLPTQQKKVFQLCKREGCSYKQAGEQLGISQNTVKEHLVKANTTVRSFLNGNFSAGLEWVLILFFLHQSF